MSFGANNFRADWYGYITNQAGHSYLVGFPLGWLMADHGIIGLVVICVAYLVVWELVFQHGRMLADSLEDAAHVTLGAAVFMMAYGAISWGFWSVITQACMLGVGSWLRMKNARSS